MVLGIEPRALHILGKCCPTTLQPSQFWFYLVLFYFETDSQQVAQARLELSWLCLLSVGIKGVLHCCSMMYIILITFPMV